EDLKDMNDYISAVIDGDEDSYAGLLGWNSPIAQVAAALKPTGEIDFWDGSDDDEFSGLRNFLRDIEALNRGIMSQDIGKLANRWDTWLRSYYDWHDPIPGQNSGLYAVLANETEPMLGGTRTDGKRSWIEQIERARDKLEYCTFGWQDPLSESCWACSNNTVCQECIFDKDNIPCKFNAIPQGTINDDTVDDIEYAIVRIEYMRDYFFENFREPILKYYQDIQDLIEAFNLAGYGGINPAYYAWEDTQGEHNVTVEAGEFNIPYLRQWSSGNWLIGKQHVALTDYTDDGRAKIRITRKDQVKDMSSGILGLFGKWNPYDPDGDGFLSITRSSKAGYEPGAAPNYKIWLRDKRW
ncbi:MAG: hypothetical protein ABIH27_00030, partial [Candidatus Omnitrophota bacterium]